MGLAPKIQKHWVRGHGLPTFHQLGSVVYLTSAGQTLCGNCASGRNGSRVKTTKHGSPRSPQWDVVERRFFKEDPWVECDHCRVRVASWAEIVINDEDEECHDGLILNPDRALFAWSKKTDHDAIGKRLVEIFSTTSEIEFVQVGKFNHSLVAKRRRKMLIHAFVNEQLISRVDGTIRINRIAIHNHLLALLRDEKRGIGRHMFGEIEITVLDAEDALTPLSNICDDLHLLVLSDAAIQKPTFRLVTANAR